MPCHPFGPIPATLTACTLCFGLATTPLAAQSSIRGDSAGVPQATRRGPELGLSVSGALATHRSDGAPLSRQFAQFAVSAGWPLATGPDVSLEYVAALIPIAVTTHDANYQYVPPPPCTAACLADLGGGTSIVTYHAVYGAGVSPLGAELHVWRRSPVSIVLGGNGGVLWFTRAVPQNNAAKLNFTASGLAALQFRTTAHSALRFGYLYHHTSNAHLGSANPGLNSSMLVISVLREP